ncbi:MAG: hypothetical protein IT379_18485 [Deltaproteobacteria bacterium]|nr:hypothetical protein [Deltaproteobacteria bacterium]
MHRRTRWAVAAAATTLAVAVGSCGGASTLEPRYVAVQGTLTALGLAQVGPILQGSLTQGATARTRQRLEQGNCYTFVGVGHSGVTDIDLLVLDAAGAEVAADTTHEQQTALQYCPSAAGEYQLVIRMTGGQGGFTVSAWTGGMSSGTSQPVAGGGAGTCGAPTAITLGSPITGDTSASTHQITPSCARGGSAPENVYSLQVTRRSQVSIALESTFDGVVYVQQTCGNTSTELACNDDAPDTSHSRVDVSLEPGTYYVIVDGYGEARGTYTMMVTTTEARPVGAVCRDAQVIATGQPVSGSTAGQSDTFQATCGGGAQSPDRVYRFDVPARSRTRVRQQSDHDGVVYIRRTCEDANTEVACNDDFIDTRHSLITTMLDPGSYFLFSDGYASGRAGNFTFSVDLAPENGGGATSDNCASAGTATVGAFSADTFMAADDGQGSCGGAGSADTVYRLDLQDRARVRMTPTNAEFRGVAYIRRACAEQASEVACGTMQPGAPILDATLDRGNYFLFVDGAAPDQFGEMQFELVTEDVRELERSCRAAPQLRTGRQVTGVTSGVDRFQATCAGGARSPETVYQLRLRRRSSVRLELAAQYDAALYIRRACMDRASEIACNDDSTDAQHSLIEQVLDAGTYFVFVDGFATNNQGSFTLTATVRPQ